jgi:hypothetical protein
MLVSPATAGNGVPWFDQFFGNCTKLYGKSGCNISYLAAHDYSCNPGEGNTLSRSSHALPIFFVSVNLSLPFKRPFVQPRLGQARFSFSFLFLSISLCRCTCLCLSSFLVAA